MKKSLRQLLLLTLFLCCGSSAQAQEGHPFAGTWRGRLVNGEENLPVVMIMRYDGENLQGMINPGRTSFPFMQVEHDAPNWRLTVTAVNRQDESISFTGVMHEIGAPDRYIEGSWVQAGKKYSFKINRE